MISTMYAPLFDQDKYTCGVGRRGYPVIDNKKDYFYVLMGETTQATLKNKDRLKARISEIEEEMSDLEAISDCISLNMCAYGTDE